MIRICPSILNADRDNLPSEIGRISQQSDLLHLDVMDNVFVPNFTFTFEQSRKIISECPIPVDSHLMIADPDASAHLYAKAGSTSVTFHYEASSNPLETISRIRDEGSRLITINNKTAKKTEEVFQYHALFLLEKMLIKFNIHEETIYIII